MATGIGKGERFGDYSLVERLAVGGMGEIWLAERKGISGFSKQVVVKTILECFVDDPELVEMFLEEGRIAAGLTHKNIAQTFDLGRVGSSYYIAMEYVKGRDLRQMLLANVKRRQFIPLNLILRVIAECCEGLYYAHTWRNPEGQMAGVIHRDISPQNVLLTFDGGVKIVDFGIAKAVHRASKTRSGVLKGKYAYMSPEQVRGEEIDQRSDQFSVGVVMYELVTAKRLFKRDSEIATLDAVRAAYVPPPRRIDGSVPREVEAILMKALHSDRTKRFADMRQMQLAIEETMLAINMPASSAHLASYMEEIFLGNGDGETSSDAVISREMENLPGVKEEPLELERTGAYTPGMQVDKSALTRNYIQAMPGFKPRRAPWKLWSLIGVLAIAVGVAGWLLVAHLLQGEKSSAGAGGNGAQDPAGPAVDGGSDSGAGMELGLDLSASPDAGSAGEQGEIAAPGADRDSAMAHVQVRKGYLSVETCPEADIYVGRNKIGRGKVSGYRLRPGRYTVKAIARPGSVKTAKVRIRAGRSVTKSIEFGSGTLRVVAIPWANVWVDGKKVGQTPLAPIKLIEGSHEVKLHNPQLTRKQVETIQIRAAQEKLLRVDWR
ncbi:MAG: serine/threonine protein kinase [Deltaproteobacteria bacterium]|nr:serine/threonine protein kinase [Deltaproteobacteria bacterium]